MRGSCTPRRPMLDVVASGLREHGLALVDGVADRDELLRLANVISTHVPHRDSDPTGLTTITDLGQPTGEGFVGFTARALDPHTDRSGEEQPPALLIMGCRNAATTGGECLLVDGKAVYDDLAESRPVAVTALSAPRSVLFGGAAGHLGSIFTHAEGRVTMRLRTDSLARFSPEVTRWLPELRAAIDRHTQVLRLAPGHGYVLDNHRWLHGRRAFTGSRALYRLHANPLPDLGLSSGFLARPVGSAAGTSVSPVWSGSA